MAFVSEEVAAAYQEAWDAWKRQVEHLHLVFLGDEKLRPDQLKGLLNREARAKDKYDAARFRLLGLEESNPDAPASDGNPFNSRRNADVSSLP